MTIDQFIKSNTRGDITQYQTYRSVSVRLCKERSWSKEEVSHTTTTTAMYVQEATCTKQVSNTTMASD